MKLIGIILLVLGFLAMAGGSVVPGLIFVVIGFMILKKQKAKKKAKTTGAASTTYQPASTPVTRTTSQPVTRTVTPQVTRTVVEELEDEDAYSYKGTVESYFETLLRGSFRDYEVRKNVLKNAWNTSFGLYQHGHLVLAVQLCSKYDWDSEWICKCQRECAKDGVVFLRFMEEFRNDSEYVVNRIQVALDRR